MKKFLFLLCAIFAFSVASAQTDKAKKDKTATKTEVKKENKQVNTPEKKADPATNVATDSTRTGIIDPTDTNTEGSNSRNNSRQNNYNKPTSSSPGSPSGNGNNTTTRPNGQ